MTIAAITPRLPVADLQRTLDFYQRTLGFAIDILWPDAAPTFAVLTRDGANVSFFLLDEHRPGRIGYAELHIEVTDVRAMHAQLQTHAPIEWGPEVYTYGRREFAVKDPDGYLLIFSEPTDESPTIDEP